MSRLDHGRRICGTDTVTCGELAVLSGEPAVLKGATPSPPFIRFLPFLLTSFGVAGRSLSVVRFRLVVFFAILGMILSSFVYRPRAEEDLVCLS